MRAAAFIKARITAVMPSNGLHRFTRMAAGAAHDQLALPAQRPATEKCSRRFRAIGTSQTMTCPRASHKRLARIRIAAGVGGLCRTV